MIPPLQRSRPADADRHRLAWASWPADLATPVALVRALRERGHRVCLLESVEGPARLARYSFVGVDPSAGFRARAGTGAVLHSAAGEQALSGGSLEALREASARVWRTRPSVPPGLPPFCGGWVGWFGYEWAAELEPRVSRAGRDPWRRPDVTLDLYRQVVAVDHAAQTLVVVVGCEDGAGHAGAQERIDGLAADALSPAARPEPFGVDGELAPVMDGASYREGVTVLREAIGSGEIFQAVLSRRFEGRSEGDPFTLYRALRLANPSPHMFFFESDGLSLVGSSPERLVSVRDGRAEARPIAGTRPRGATPEEDERLGARLRADVKERAEHDMLVDLARNDLGRVARIGTVAVREYAALERFARVQHLVSRVECELAADRDALDALAACFPAGTVSGAPKVRAMELLAGLETDTRGPYAGCFGYLDGAGDLDMALIIRSFALQDGTLSVQSGAGIVADSSPEREERETLHKARALLDAVLAARAPTWAAEPLTEATP